MPQPCRAQSSRFFRGGHHPPILVLIIGAIDTDSALRPADFRRSCCIDSAGKVDADAVEAQLLIERRQALGRMTADEKLKTISKARIAGDVDLLRAVVGAPAYITGINDVTLDLCRQKLIELQGSAEVGRADKLRRNIDSAKRSLASSRDFIRRHTSRDGRKKAGEGVFADEMTASEKANFIKKFGLNAWQKVVERTYG